MSATVRTVWPTFVGDAGQPRKFVVVWPGDHVPSWGSLHVVGRDYFATRKAAQDAADRWNRHPR